MPGFHKHFISTLVLPAVVTLWQTGKANAVEYEYESDETPPSAVQSLYDLRAVAQRAAIDNRPILIEFATPWCEFCEALEQQILAPLINSGDFEDRIIIGKLEIDSYSSMIDFNGESLSTADFSTRHRVDLYPTLVFFDAGGSELGQRIVGITVLDYVAQRLETAIADAIIQTAAQSRGRHQQ